MHYSDSIALLKGPGPSELDVIAGVGGAFDTTNQRRSSGSTTDSTRATSPLAVGVRKGSAGSLSLVGADMVHSIAGVYGAPVTESPRNSVLGEGNLRKLAVQNNMSFVNVCPALPLRIRGLHYGRSDVQPSAPKPWRVPPPASQGGTRILWRTNTTALHHRQGRT